MKQSNFNSFHYLIEVPNLYTGMYIQYLLNTYGLLYPWEVKVNNESESVIKLIINRSVGAKSQAKDQVSNYSFAELIITSNSKILRKNGIIRGKKIDKEVNQHGHIITNAHYFGQKIPDIAFPVYTHGFYYINNYNNNLDSAVYLTTGEKIIFPIAFSHNRNKINRFIMCLDFMSFIYCSMTGHRQGIINDNMFKEWTEIYSRIATQSIALKPFIDNFIKLLIKIIIEIAKDAFPLIVEPFPPGKTAPIIITGDTDDATSNDIKKYLSELNSQKIGTSILFKKHKKYKLNYKKISISKNAYGIHPYADNGTVNEYINCFNNLVKTHRLLIGTPISCLRNHSFQWIDYFTTIIQERNEGIYFDLNCITADGKMWIGSGSGIGLPLPFPVVDKEFKIYPMQLPTIIEDDVFIYDYDYCYTSLKDGSYITRELIKQVIKIWIINNKLPMVLNLHQEHVRKEKRILLDEVIDIIKDNNVWTPSLTEYNKWLQNRNKAIVIIRYFNKKKKIVIKSKGPLLLRILKKKDYSDKNIQFIRI